MLPGFISHIAAETPFFPALAMLAMTGLLALRFRMREMDAFIYNGLSGVLLLIFAVSVVPAVSEIIGSL